MPEQHSLWDYYQDQFGGDDSDYKKYSERVIGDDNHQNCAIITTTNYDEYSQRDAKPKLFRLASAQTAVNSVVANLGHSKKKNISGFIVDEDLEGSTEQLELSISQLDRSLREVNMRSEFSLLAEGQRVHGTDDIFKLIALGADAVGIGQATLLAIGFEEVDRAVVFDPSKSTKHLENLVIALEKDLKLLCGAAGVSSFIFNSRRQ